jgi:hypothetical protein
VVRVQRNGLLEVTVTDRWNYSRFHPDDVAEFVAAHRVEVGTVAGRRR